MVKIIEIVRNEINHKDLNMRIGIHTVILIIFITL